ncbi:DUF4012 domain-containing protein [Candidatus Uhrbacteria bacterium]|nr:MAG: DUF4012 domain-containing protein [Candidatus Uhrbacteria bacterium]
MDFNVADLPWKRVALGVGIALTIALLIIVSPVIYGSLVAGGAAVSLQSHLRGAVADAGVRDFSAAESGLIAAENDLSNIRGGLRAMGNWREAPWIGTRLKALEQVERSGSSAISGFREMLSVVADIQEAVDTAGIVSGVSVDPGRSYQDLSREEKRALFENLNAALPRLRLAREKITIAADAWKNVPQDELFSPIRSAIVPLADRLPELDESLGQGLSLLEWIVPLSGFPEAKTYLVLLQNADELRPTGGFIGNIGLVTVDAGDIKSIEFEDVYALDNLVTDTWRDVPPALMTRELGVRAWFLRDSNWSPDYPQSAARLIDVYQRMSKQGRNIDVRLDGVIALQPEFFRRLLILTGPLTVEDQTFTANDFFDQLQFETQVGFHQEGRPTEQRKDIVRKLGDVLIATLLSLPANRWPDVLDVATVSLAQGDMLVYAKDEAVQEILDLRGWSGRTIGTEDDYLWVIDANLAALKTDGVMDKRIFYSVDFTDPSGPVATVRLRYTNTNRIFDWRYTRYRAYTRVYVPEGSELLSWAGISKNPDVFRELGKQVFGAFWVIEPGKTGEMVFKYRLPARIATMAGGDSYRFLAQKQPGAERTLTLDLLFGKNVQRAAPPEDESDFGDTRYRYEGAWIESQPFQITF